MWRLLGFGVGVWVSATAAQPAAADADGQAVIAAVVDHYARIESVRVSGTSRYLQDGFAAPDPAAARPVYRTGAEVVEFEHWAAPPRLRVSDKRLRDGRRTSEGLVSFDGKVYTLLNPARKNAVIDETGASLRPLSESSLHALGFTYPDAYQGSLADLLADRSKVTVSAGPPRGGRPVWVIDISALPGSVHPRDTTDYIRKNTRINIWVSTQPHTVVWQWGIYFRSLGRGPELEPPSPQCFKRDGYYLVRGYVNGDFQPTTVPGGGAPLHLPRRALYGNGAFSLEYRLREVAVNPPVRADSFRPAVPTGYAVERTGQTGEGVVAVAGGRVGEEVRVTEISAAARELLDSPAGLEAPPPPGWWAWLGLFMGATLTVGLVAVWRRAKRRRLP